LDVVDARNPTVCRANNTMRRSKDQHNHANSNGKQYGDGQSSARII
jgi:hypothetical protein